MDSNTSQQQNIKPTIPWQYEIAEAAFAFWDNIEDAVYDKM